MGGKLLLLIGEVWQVFLLKQWYEKGLILPNPNVKIGLAAGKIYSKDEPKIIDHFKINGWILLTPGIIFQRLKELENSQYENDPYVIASKIISMNQNTAT